MENLSKYDTFDSLEAIIPIFEIWYLEQAFTFINATTIAP